ncbi:MAG: PAS domain-containing protein [Nitrospinae bacterium]|nr:PAS domain-containing protein [Nitrospinota bacterium]
MENNFRKRLIIFFIATVSLLLSLDFIAYYTLHSIQRQFSEVENKVDETHHINNLSLAIEKVVMPANDYIITGNIKYRGEFERLSKDVEFHIENLKKRVTEKEMKSHGAEDLAIIKEVEELYKEVKAVSLEIMNIPEPFGNKRAAELMEKLDYSLKDPLIEKLKNMQEWHYGELEIIRRIADRSGKQSLYTFFVISIILITIAVFYSLNVIRIYNRHESERNTLLRAVEKSKKDWEHTFDAIADLVSIHDKDYRIIKANKSLCEKFKIPYEELIGKKCYEIFHHSSSPLSICPHHKTMETGESALAEVNDPNMGGTFIVSTFPIFDEQKKFIGSVHIARDVTKERQLQMQFIQAEKLATVGTLVSGVAHEINNPLTSVIGYSELLLDNEGLSDDIKKDIMMIHKEASRVAKVAQNLLSFVREHKPMRSMVDIHDILERTISLRAYELKVHNIELSKEFDFSLPGIYADQHQLQQVFLNLITNAEYEMIESRHKGRLVIKIEKDGDIIRIIFHDNGRGISPENIDKIFSAFFTTKPAGKGTGLGLSLSRDIIEKHDGRLYAESLPGSGAKFIIELPIGEGTKEKD